MKENTEHIIDTSTFEGVARGSEEAFSTLVHILYRKFSPFVISLVKSDTDADDVMQEVFLKIWLHRASMQHIENPMGWVFKVIANTAANHIRACLREELRIKAVRSQPAVINELEEELQVKFTQSLIDEAVGLLPEKRKLVFLLSKKEGLSRKEIAERLNISENTVRNQLAEAVRFIRDQLHYRGELILPSILILFSIPG